MAGLLDYLYDPSTYGGNGGLLSRLAPGLGAIPQSQGFPQQDQASFTPSGRTFDAATFDPATYAPNQAQPIAVGGYQMPRVGSADLFQPQQAMLPQNATPTQGQIQQQPMNGAPQMPSMAQSPDVLPPALQTPSALTRIFNPNGLIARLTGNDTRSVAQQNLRAQYDATRQLLQQNGLSPQEASSRALMAVMNPEAGKTILSEALTNKEKFQKTGQDPVTGVDQYGFVNERDQTINGKPIGQTQAPANNGLGDPNLTGEAYLQSLPENIRSQVKAIVEGRMQPPSGFALKSPQIQALMRAAAQYEPGFDLTKWGSRASTAKDFASGAAAKNVTSLNTVVGHLADLKEKAADLDNGSIPIFNQIGNAYHSATGGAKVNNFNLARNAVADELAKVFKGSGISDHEIAQWKETLNAAQSPEQLKGAIKTAIGLMDSRLSALNDQRDRGMSTQSEPRSLLNEKSKKSLEAVEQWANGTEKTDTKASGSISEGMTATNPQTGQKIIFKSGKWVPAQ